MRRMIASCLLFVALLCSQTVPQPPRQAFVLDWLPQSADQSGLLESLHKRLNRWLDVVVRYTSPDIPRQLRRLWRISADGNGKCLLAPDTAVRFPRWGSMGEILFLVDADTNGDGQIDFRDEFEVRVLAVIGGKSKTVTQAASAVWSPDGKYIAIIHNQELEVVNSAGQGVSASMRPAGRIVLSDSLNPQLASEFRAFNPQNGAITPLPDDLSKKYLWLGMMSPDATRVVYPDATRRSILTRLAGDRYGQKLIGGNGIYLDPAWSPDGRYIIYVSTELEGATCGKP